MNRLMDRFQGHFQCIRNNGSRSEVAKHFNKPDHEGKQDVKIHILDFIHAHHTTPMAKSLRDLIEFHWIHRLGSVLPIGLNTMDKAPTQTKWYSIWKASKN